MKKMNTTTKRKIAGIVAIILIIAMLLSSILPFFMMTARADEAKSDFTVEAVIGFDSASGALAGVVYSDSFNLFSIKIKNNSGKAFNGYLQIPIATEYDYDDKATYCNYYSSLELNKDEEKSLEYSLPIYDIGQDEIKINILDSDKKLIQVNRFIIQSISDPMLGIMSNSGTYIRLVSGLNEEKGSDSRAFNIIPQNFENDNYMSKTAIIIIDDFDLTELTTGQKQALKQWIENGGVLLLCQYKPEYSQNLKEIFENISNKDYLNLNGYKFGYVSDNINSQTTSHLYKLGMGAVAVTGFSPTDSNRFQLNNTELMAVIEGVAENADFDRTDNNDINHFSYYNYYNVGEIFDDNFIIPTIIIISLYIYAIGMGPVLYVILNKRNKKDLIIKIVPTIAFTLTGVIFVLSMGSNYNKGVIGGYSVVDVSNGNSISNEIISRNIISVPRKNNIDVQIDSNSEILTVTSDDFISKNKNAAFAEIDMDKNSVEFLNSKVWQENVINVRTSVNFDGALENNIIYNMGTGLLSGTVTNNTGHKLKDCYIGAVTDDNIKLCFIDNMENGKTIDLEGLDFENVTGSAKMILKNNKNLTQIRKNMANDFIRIGAPNNNGEVKLFAFGFADDIDNPVTVKNKNTVSTMDVMLQSVKTDVEYNGSELVEEYSFD